MCFNFKNAFGNFANFQALISSETQYNASITVNNDVGYKRPPRQTQFKPGHSGNPSGKKKGTRNIATELREILLEQITTVENGVSKTMSKQRALASALVAAAVNGDLRAIAIVLDHSAPRHSENTDSDDSINGDFSAVIEHQQRKSQSP